LNILKNAEWIGHDLLVVGSAVDSVCCASRSIYLGPELDLASRHFNETELHR
jgi:hypothetical protein